MSDDDDQADNDAVEQEGEPTAQAETPRSAKARIKLEQEQARLFWQQVFDHPVGRREMWGLLQSAHAFEERFACGPTGFPQPEATWFHAGEQAFGQRLYHSWLRQCPQGVVTMMFEHDPRFPKPAPPKRKRGQE